VIERRPGQLDDVGVATEVLGVTGLALRTVDRRQPAVEPALSADVRTDVLVAVHAQRWLPAAVGAVVALRAFLLDLGVPSNDLARHQQGFQASRIRAPARHDRGRHDQHGKE
jgi:hypothetical protein